MLDDEFVSYKRIELDFEYLYELPEFLKDNTYSNPYSNMSLNIPPGLGFLDQQFGQNLTDYQTQYTNEPDNTLISDSQIPNSALERGVYVAKRLMLKGGFTKELAAAIAGTMIDENGCDPHSYMKAEKSGKGAKGTGGNGYGAGIGSWTGLLKQKVLTQAGYSPNTKIENLSMDLLIDMLIIDSLTGSKKYYDALRRCKTIEDASATSVLITGGVGKSKNWNTHPTQEDAKRLSDWYGISNDKRFGKSPYHWNLDVRRLNYSKQILSRL